MWPYFSVPLIGHINQVWLYIYIVWNMKKTIYGFALLLIDHWLMSSKQYFPYIQDENKFNNV
jgi:hypothetical protein